MFKIIIYWNGKVHKTKLYQSHKTFILGWKYHFNKPTYEHRTLKAFEYKNTKWKEIKEIIL